MTRLRRLLTAVALAAASLVSLGGDVFAETHEVEKGETLSHIARRYGVTIKALRAKNGIARGAPIQIGQALQIPTPASEAGPNRNQDEGEAPSREAPASTDGARTNWVTAKPPQSTQTQKSAKDRGMNPCLTKDPGFGIYTKWNRAPTMGQMIIPERGGVSKDGSFDVMFHFHGHEAVRKEWVQVMKGPVLVGIDLGNGSGPYASSFASPDAFKRLVESVEDAVAEHTGKKSAHARKIGLSAWSAGYGAVEQILRGGQGSRVDLVVLLDGLHAGYTGDMVNEKQLEPFLEFARLARSKQRFMFVSHSSIIPPGYASTTETANFLIWKLGGKPTHSAHRASDPAGLDLISRYSRGNFHVRGYSGNDKMDHCAHLGLLRDVLKVHVNPRWRSPRGFAARRAEKG